MGEYAKAEPWLKALMDAWADGLNYYLHTHPEVKPRVLTRFEPWMALSFSEGSIGGDIEQINLEQLEAFYKSPMLAQGTLPSTDNGLDATSAVQCELLRSVSRRRLVHRIGVVDAEAAFAVDRILRTLLGH